MKKRGKKKIKHSKKKIFFNKKLFVIAIIAFFVFAFLLSFVNVQRTSITGAALTTKQEESLIKFVENPVVKITLGDPIDSMDAFPEGIPLGEFGIIIIYIMVWLILFVAFGDIFGTFMPFTHKFVAWFLGFGMAVITANFGVITKVIAWGATITSVFGAFSIFVAMIIAFVFFIIVTVAGGKLRTKILKERWKLASEAGGARAAIAIKNLAEIQKSLEKAGSK